MGRKGRLLLGRNTLQTDEDALGRSSLGIIVITAHFASEMAEVGDNTPLPRCMQLSQIKFSKSLVICYCLSYWY